MKSFLLAAGSSLCFLPCVYGQVNQARDGTWWRSQTETARLVYATGLMDGTVAELIAQMPTGFFTIPGMIEKSTNDQIVDGLSLSYKDFRNRHIHVTSALLPVAMEICGTDETVVSGVI